MTNCQKGHRCGGRRRGHESLISPHLRFTIPDLRRPTPDRVNRISYIENFRPLPSSLHYGAPGASCLASYASPQLSTFNLQLVRGRPQGPFKIKNHPKTSKNSSNPIKSNQGLFCPKNSEFFSGHFCQKSLANRAKTAQKTPQKWSKNTLFLTCFESALTIQTRPNAFGVRSGKPLL